MHLDNGISVGKSFLQSPLYCRIMGAKEVSAMICPYCDSLLKTVPENGCCPNCNAPLGAAPQEEENVFPTPPLGVYQGVFDDSLEIGEQSLIIRKHEKITNFESEFELRYEDLTGVFFQSVANMQVGFLSIRSRINEETPLLMNAADVAAVSFSTVSSAIFLPVYEFLLKCVAAAKKIPQKEKKVFAQAPIGVYKGVGGQMELTADSVIFTKKLLLLPQTRYVIAYDALYDVCLVEPTFLTNGKLCVKCWENRNSVHTKLSDNETSLVLTGRQQKLIRKAYEFLKNCCRNAKVGEDKER